MAELVTEFVTGAQNNSVGKSVGDAGFLQAGTCCKVCPAKLATSRVCMLHVAVSRSFTHAAWRSRLQHFAAYDIENVPTSRQTFNAELTSRDMWETCASAASYVGTHCSCG